jgi:hypothetical protein
MGKLDLQRALSRARPPPENLEDQAGAVDYLRGEGFFEIAESVTSNARRTSRSMARASPTASSSRSPALRAVVPSSALARADR